MIFERIKTPGLASVAYLVGDEKEGLAVVVDPGRDIATIIEKATGAGVTIRFILETHRQEDFVIGAKPLAEKTGATIVVGRDPHFGHGDLKLADGEELAVGSLRFRALHTPGHTPESMCYALYVDEIGDTAWGVFTGDTLFIGEAGRTDLPDRTKTAENAGLLYDAVHAKIAPLGDQTLIFPAHGSGSVCGGQIAQRDDSSIGLEKVTNPVFTKTRDEFVAAKVDERIPRPPYFRHMEKVNAAGGAGPATTPADVKVLQPRDFQSDSKQGLVVDAREPEAFAAGHLPGSVNIWADGLILFGGWLADAATPVYLVPADGTPASLQQAVKALGAVGIDEIRGVLAGGFESWRDAGLPVDSLGTTTARDVDPTNVRVLDVRDDTEYEKDGHIPGSSHLFVGYVADHLDALKPPLRKDEPVVVTCQVGHRAGVATSLLRAKGFTDVRNLLGGVDAWTGLGQPLEKGPSERSVTTPDVEGERR